MGALAKVAADLQPERIKPELLPCTANLLPDNAESLLNSKQTVGKALFNYTPVCLKHWGEDLGREAFGRLCVYVRYMLSMCVCTFSWVCIYVSPIDSSKD